MTGSAEFTDQPRSEDVQFLEDQINEHNMVGTGRRDFRPLAFYLRDEQMASSLDSTASRGLGGSTG